jgi:uncharacterized protein (TIGR03118 family)
MALQESDRRPRPLRKLLTAATLTLGTVGVLAAAAPAQPGESPHRHHHGFQEIDLVSDIKDRAQATDSHLVNPWGLTTARSGELWVSDNGSDTASTYSGGQKGRPVRILSQVVSFPANGAPTGVVRNDSDRFEFSDSGKTGPARFIFAGEHGDLFAFNKDVSPANAVPVAHEDSGNQTAIFKGLTLVHGRDRDEQGWKGHKHEEPRVLVANFRDARVDIFGDDSNFVSSPGAFQDPSLPTGFAPFDVKEIGSKVFVTYALQNPEKQDDVAGPGNGFIDVFSKGGSC